MQAQENPRGDSADKRYGRSATSDNLRGAALSPAWQHSGADNKSASFRNEGR